MCDRIEQKQKNYANNARINFEYAFFNIFVTYVRAYTCSQRYYMYNFVRFLSRAANKTEIATAATHETRGLYRSSGGGFAGGQFGEI